MKPIDEWRIVKWLRSDGADTSEQVFRVFMLWNGDVAFAVLPIITIALITAVV